MTLTQTSLSDRLERFARDHSLSLARVEPLVGDASNRAYFRLHLSDETTRIASLLPEPFDSKSHPFLDVLRLFQQIPIRVPRVFAEDGAQGVLLLEDLGDAMLQDVVSTAEPDEKSRLYREAIDILLRIQRRGSEFPAESSVALTIAFDAEKFLWELDFFREHFVTDYLGASLDSRDEAELAGEFESIVAELLRQPFVLCHRDYHARNLMVVDDGLAVIDFQDARMGPPAYDLVSLLNDSYVQHTADFVDVMRRYFDENASHPVGASYDVAALQRNLKALGTFGFQISRRGNDVYRQYVDHTLSLVDSNLERHPRFGALRRILRKGRDIGNV